MNNRYIIQQLSEDNIEIRPKLCGGGKIKMTFYNVRGMPSDKKMKNKILAINNLTKDQQLMIYTETAC